MATDEGIKRVEITDSNTLVESPYSTVVFVDQKQQVQKVGFNKADDDIYSIVNINGTKQQTKEEEAQGKSEKPFAIIISVDNISCMNKATEANGLALDKLAMIKKSQEKIRPKASKCTTNDSHHGIRFRIDQANTMADENASVSLGNVRLKTKL